MTEDSSFNDIPPVFMSLDEIETLEANPKEMWKGPWEKKETRELFNEIFESNRLGVSADPTDGKNFEFNVDMALRSTPGNVEVSLLWKTANPEQGQLGWQDISEGRFANAATLFLDSPNTLPTVHAPVDVNWVGLKREDDNKLVLSEDEIQKELSWLRNEIPKKVRPFVNTIALKKEGISLWEDEEVNVDKNFRMPIVFHSTPATAIFGRGPQDILRTTSDVWVDEKTGEIVFAGDIEKLAKAEGKEWEPIENSYVPLKPDGKDIKDHLNFHKGLVNEVKSLYKGVFKENTFTEEEINKYLNRVKEKNSLYREISERSDERMKKQVSDLSVQISKLESSENKVSELYKEFEEFKDAKPEQILDNNYFVSQTLKEKIQKLLPLLHDSLELAKLENVGITNEKLKEVHELYRELEFLTTRHGTKEEIENKAKELASKLKELYKQIEEAHDFILPQQKREIANQLATTIRDIYKRLGDKEDLNKFDETIKKISESGDVNQLYSSVKKELEKLSDKIKGSKKKLIDIKPIENVAVEKASNTIAEFAKDLVKDPVLRENAFVAIENFFPQDLFGGKIEIDGKKEWAMKVLLEKSREKFKEKVKQEGIAKSEEEAQKLADEFIGMTLDMGHFNLWRSRGVFKDKEEEKFQEMAADFVESVKPFVRHIHLTDNPGTADTHQEIGTGNVPNELALTILREEWKKKGITPTVTIEWGGPSGLGGTQPSNYENWRTATIPGYQVYREKALSTLYQSFSYHPPSGIYYKSEPYLTSWLR